MSDPMVYAHNKVIWVKAKPMTKFEWIVYVFWCWVAETAKKFYERGKKI